MSKTQKKSSSRKSRTSKSIVSSVYKSFMKSKMVLYMILVLAILNVLHLLSNNDLPCLGMFIVAAGVTYYFTKNMKLVLGVPLVLSSVYSCSMFVKEGLENKKDDEEETEEKKEKEKFVGTKIQPKSLDEDEDEEPDVYIDKSQTIENAYASLDEYLDSEGLKKLSEDTNNLIKKQSQLMNSMKQMGPLMKNMDGIMKSLNDTDMSQFSKVQDNLHGMVDKMSNSSKKK